VPAIVKPVVDYLKKHLFNGFKAEITQIGDTDLLVELSKKPAS
jgi:hypothetical protein